MRKTTVVATISALLVAVGAVWRVRSRRQCCPCGCGSEQHAPVWVDAAQ